MKFEWEKKEKEKTEPVFMSENKMDDMRNKAQQMVDNNFFD